MPESTALFRKVELKLVPKQQGSTSVDMATSTLNGRPH